MQFALHVVALAILMSLVTPSPASAVGLVDAEPTFIARSDAWVIDIQTSGDRVVWTTMEVESHVDYLVGDIYLANIADGTVSAFATGPEEQAVCDIDGDLLAWYEQTTPDLGQSGVVNVTDLATDETMTIDSDWCVGVSGGTLAYIGSDGNLWLHDFGSTTPTLAVESDFAIAWAAFQDGWLVWTESTPLDSDHPYNVHKRMIAKAVGSNDVIVLDEGWGNSYVSLSGNLALTSNLHDRPDHGVSTDDFFVVTDLATGAVTQMPVSENCWALVDAGPRYATLYCPLGDWATDSMVALDLHALSIFPLDVVDRNPYTRGGSYELAAGDERLVWAEQRDAGEWLILATDWRNIVPSAPLPDPGTTDLAWHYFPESGHFLHREFKTFWDGSGGLPVFGYSLTEPFTEQNDDTGGFYTVQWFERQRYELHPENAGTPYEVLLGRLGVELLTEQGRDWTTFPKADPSSPHYFPETDHAIAPEFIGYWSSHGLEVGDAGVSFRESLALFGYPISETMTETNADGDTVLTQYFERAVFEHHPDNAGTEYEVLLRRVGAEMLEVRGW